jgi:hypothetical protein
MPSATVDKGQGTFVRHGTDYPSESMTPRRPRRMHRMRASGFLMMRAPPG